MHRHAAPTRVVGGREIERADVDITSRLWTAAVQHQQRSGEQPFTLRPGRSGDVKGTGTKLHVGHRSAEQKRKPAVPTADIKSEYLLPPGDVRRSGGEGRRCKQRGGRIVQLPTDNLDRNAVGLEVRIAVEHV